MDTPELPHLIFRWLHVLAGVMFVGQLWSLALILRAPTQALDPGLSQASLRAHAWHRWSGTLTWITGLPLLGIVYYSGGAVTPEQSLGLATGAGLVAIAAAFGLYDTLWSRLVRAPGLVLLGWLITSFLDRPREAFVFSAPLDARKER